MSVASPSADRHAELGPPRPAAGVRWHAVDPARLREALGIEIDCDRGLTEAAAQHRLEREGPNRLAEPQATPWWRRLLAQFAAPLVSILVVAAAGALLLGEIVDAAVILAVVLANAAIGFVQEGKALRAIEAIAGSLRTESCVMRDGRWRRIDAAGLVRGDLVRLEPGDRVPADLRLISARELEADESMLTGESLPVGKRPEAVAADAELGDRASMAHAGSLVVRGRGRGIAVAVGDATELGGIGALVASADRLATPLTRRIAALSRLLLLAILPIAAAVLGIGLLQERPFTQSLMAAVAFAVAAIPEGLPAGVTIVLAIGVGRMAERKAIVRHLPAVEALGAATIICSDKTGTLTENEMTVVAVLAGGQRFEFSGAGYDPAGVVSIAGEPVPLETPPALAAALEAGVLCNDARHHAVGGVWTIEGDPTEASLLVAARKAGIDPDAVARGRPRLDTIEFESERQFMATRHGDRGGGPSLGCIKGAVEVLLPWCGAMLDRRGEPQTIDREAIAAAAAAMGREGLRVLALARLDRPDEAFEGPPSTIRGGVTLLGVAGMLDPPRPEVREAVAACRSAGIGVKMVTGDHAATAASIAAMVGIGGAAPGEPPPAMSGREIEACSDESLAEALQRIDVLARVSPAAKLRVVKALQSRGEIVAMTGDGVNDAPALRQADLGLAMGLSGTEAAKAAADIVLADDRFATIAAAVEEGRGVDRTLLRFIAWTLPTNGGEGLVILASLLAGGPLPLLPVQAMWINMSTTLLLGVPLAFERRDPDLMRFPPADPRRPVIDLPLLLRIGLVSLLLWLAATAVFRFELSRHGMEATARSAAGTAIVAGEILYLFSTRSGMHPISSVPFASNRWLLGGIVAMVLGQAAVVSLPPLQRIFGTGPLDALGVAAVAVAAAVVMAGVELEKWIRRAGGRSAGGRGGSGRGV